MKCKFFSRFLALLLMAAFLLAADSSVEDLKKTVVETGKLEFIRDVRQIPRP